MKEAFIQIAVRFQREKELMIRRTKNTCLFIVSDGKSTDGDPLPAVEFLKRWGVTVFSCYITNQDITASRVLPNTKEFWWDEGARLMFDMASPYQANAHYADFFREKEWTINEPNARLFAQLNHSTLLEEFMEIALFFTERETPRGK